MSKLLENKERRTQAIIDAAEKMLTESTWDNVQMQDIANEAGVGVATLFRYFPKKQMLIIAVASQILSEELDFYRSVNLMDAAGIRKVEAIFTRVNRLGNPDALKKSKFIDIFESNIGELDNFVIEAEEYFKIRNNISDIVSRIVNDGQADKTLPSGADVTDEIMTMINNYSLFARKLALMKDIMTLEKEPGTEVQLKIMRDMYMERLRSF
ncbi:TetR/AcrR family transcriptional regulator [Jeotgalicoccus halotolerans]|uniref:TetR family transcriptional regulator n=1 Tax=Jeotgalicoccus halotolerans TaxID=157227 RepID=A0A3E0AYW1_9STAP|nr:helix-turn-helix domain-containing protein [Jeotgalicoccus halotolerans]REG24899.1 TetR family transcriptional regulator [Jeotgalicoccus halotolerans]